MSLNERKVCIVFSTSGRSFEDPSGEYMVFVVDLKWESGESCDEIVTLLTPTVRFNISHDSYEAAFCVLGSTLYMFDGYRFHGRGDVKSMYTYQLSDGISNLKLEKSMLSEGPAMNEIKVDPRAVVAPNGKILVFPRNICCSSSTECDFEMYDPVDGVWEKLPKFPPCLACYPNNSYDIESFAFMEGNVFFVKTDMGAFSLDITARNKVWKINGFHCAARLPYLACIPLVLINKEICIIPYVAYDITKYEEHEDVFRLCYEFPDLSGFTDNYKSMYGGDVALLENRVEASKAFNVCLLHPAKNKKTKDLELLLQVYSCNLKECRKELRKYRKKKIEEHPNWMDRKMDTFEFPGANKVKSLRIVVKKDPLYKFYFCSYASIQPIEIAQESRI